MAQKNKEAEETSAEASQQAVETKDMLGDEDNEDVIF